MIFMIFRDKIDTPKKPLVIFSDISIKNRCSYLFVFDLETLPVGYLNVINDGLFISIRIN